MIHLLFLLYQYYLCLSCKFYTKIIRRNQNTNHFYTYAEMSLVYPSHLLCRYYDLWFWAFIVVVCYFKSTKLLRSPLLFGLNFNSSSWATYAWIIERVCGFWISYDFATEIEKNREFNINYFGGGEFNIWHWMRLDFACKFLGLWYFIIFNFLRRAWTKFYICSTERYF